MNSPQRLQHELLAASNESLIQRAVKGSVLYPVTTVILLLVTDWRTHHLVVGATFFGLTLLTAIIRSVYLKWLLKRPDTYANGTPRGLMPILLAPSLIYGVQAATTFELFGLENVTSELTLLLVFGFAAGGTSSLAMNRRIHSMFLVLMLVPFIIMALATGTSTTIASAGFVILYGGFLRREGQTGNAAFVQLLERGFELRKAFSALEIKQAQVVAAHDNVQLVMDNVEEGLCIVDADGIIQSRGSKAFETWFGMAIPGTGFGEQIRDPDLPSGLRFRWRCLLRTSCL
jgi:hypothetical protein